MQYLRVLFTFMLLLTAVELKAQINIGDIKDGGMVFYVDKSGQHGLISDLNDLGDMSWDAADNACKKKGEGWRLPTLKELNLLYKAKDKVGGFQENPYWTSSVGDNNNAVNGHWTKSFMNGVESNYGKIAPLCVRAIRSF